MLHQLSLKNLTFSKDSVEMTGCEGRQACHSYQLRLYRRDGHIAGNSRQQGHKLLFKQEAGAVSLPTKPAEDSAGPKGHSIPKLAWVLHNINTQTFGMARGAENPAPLQTGTLYFTSIPLSLLIFKVQWGGEVNVPELIFWLSYWTETSKPPVGLSVLKF